MICRKTDEVLKCFAVVAGVALWLSGCGRESRPEPGSDPTLGSRGSAVEQVAREKGIEPRLLLAAAYSQSRFGAGVAAQESLPGVSRTAPFNLVGEGVLGTSEAGAVGLVDGARQIADRVLQRSKDIKPSDSVAWMAVFAGTIASNVVLSDDLARVQRRLVFEDLVRVYNAGFQMILSDGEVVRLAPAPKPVQVARETTIAMGAGVDWPAGGEVWPGPQEAEVSVRGRAEEPRILLRHCPGSPLMCFDFLRKTTTVGSHFMAFFDANRKLRLIHMHDLSRDLRWYDGVANDVISVTLTGFAEESSLSPDPNWFTWDDLQQLRGALLDVLTVGRARRGQGPSLGGKSLADFVIAEEAEQVVFPVPPGQVRFALPRFWDPVLTRAVLDGSALGQCGADALVLNGEDTEPIVINDGSVRARLQVGDAVQMIATDLLTSTGGWELIRKTEVVDKRVFTFLDSFASEGDQVRVVVVRFRALDAARKNCGYQVVRRVSK